MRRNFAKSGHTGWRRPRFFLSCRRRFKSQAHHDLLFCRYYFLSFECEDEHKIENKSGGSPGIVVIGGEGCGFESIYWMDMTFFTLICCNNCIVCLKWLKIMKKRMELAHKKIENKRNLAKVVLNCLDNVSCWKEIKEQ